tara:strand:- start:195 stop:908 length:714 start_codon:yes stop_codon:yes gene_type:complete
MRNKLIMVAFIFVSSQMTLARDTSQICNEISQAVFGTRMLSNLIDRSLSAAGLSPEVRQDPSTAIVLVALKKQLTEQMELKRKELLEKLPVHFNEAELEKLLEHVTSDFFVQITEKLSSKTFLEKMMLYLKETDKFTSKRQKFPQVTSLDQDLANYVKASSFHKQAEEACIAYSKKYKFGRFRAYKKVEDMKKDCEKYYMSQLMGVFKDVFTSDELKHLVEMSSDPLTQRLNQLTKM